MGKMADQVADSLDALARRFPHLAPGADLSRASNDDAIDFLAALSETLANELAAVALELDLLRAEISHRPPA